MDHKAKIIDRLQERFSLSGQGQAVLRAAVAVAGAAETIKLDTAASGGRKTARQIVAARCGHLDEFTRDQIESLLLLEENFPLRGFLTDDQRRAGIYCTPEVRNLHWHEYGRYSRLFFGPAHVAICTVFKNELQAVARRYGKVSDIPVEVLPYE